MDEFSNTSRIEESLNIAGKDWNRIRSAAEKGGYREGIDNGSESVFQEGFDIGYEEAFKTAFVLGKFKSLLNAVPHNMKHPQNISEILDKTRRGACHICETEFQNKSDDTQKQFSDIINDQRAHSIKVIETLYGYFQPYIRDLNINESNILEIPNQVPQLFEDN